MKKAAVSVFGVVIALLACLYAATWLLPFPHFEILTNCNKPSLSFSFNAPPGDNLNFILAFRNITNLTDLRYPTFSGKMMIRDTESNILSLAIPTEKPLFPFWLNREENLAGFPLVLPNQKSQHVQRFIKPMQSYEVDFIFTKPPPRDSELWLMWRQRRIDGNGVLH